MKVFRERKKYHVTVTVSSTDFVDIIIVYLMYETKLKSKMGIG